MDRNDTPSSKSNAHINLSSILPEVMEDKAEERQDSRQQNSRKATTKASGRKNLFVLSRQSSDNQLPSLN